MDKVYITEEVADALRVSVFTVRRLLNSERLHGFKVGKDWRIIESDLQAFIVEARPLGENLRERD